MEWISIKDRLPEVNQEVLVYDPNFNLTANNIYVAELSGDGFLGKVVFVTCDQEGLQVFPTHWMSLPSSPG